MPRRIETIFVPGPAGPLESLLEEPEEGEPRQAVLVCHPHPQFGGTMHNKVVYRLARGFRRAGAAVLRFNYRGVNLSAGAYDQGIGELEDARTELAFLRQRYPDLPFSIAGFSFGARITLKLGCEIPETKQLIAAGFAARDKAYHDTGRCPKPRYFIQSTHDEFGPAPDMQAYFDSLPGPKELIWIPAQDHFFTGALDEFEQAVVGIASNSGQH